MKNIFLSSFFMIIIICNTFANNYNYNTIDSSRNFYKPLAISSTLIISGCLLTNSLFEKNFTKTIRDKVGHDFRFRIDDVIQYLPTTQVYIGDIIGIKSRNNWKLQTNYLLFANGLSSLITHSLKRIINKTRPYGGQHSFPSGHSTFSFTNTTALFYEFYQSSPLWASSGFLFASTTGAFRIINNRHWLSDVLTGAGIGIFSTTIIYMTKPLCNLKMFKQKNITYFPSYQNDKLILNICIKI